MPGWDVQQIDLWQLGVDPQMPRPQAQEHPRSPAGAQTTLGAADGAAGLGRRHCQESKATIAAASETAEGTPPRSRELGPRRS